MHIVTKDENGIFVAQEVSGNFFLSLTFHDLVKTIVNKTGFCFFCNDISEAEKQFGLPKESLISRPKTD